MTCTYRYRRHGLDLDPAISGLRPQQEEVLEWAANSRSPYLLVNAPTESGKTLILSTFGLRRAGMWTYSVHTIRLQEQVASTFAFSLPVKGRKENNEQYRTHTNKTKYDSTYKGHRQACKVG